MTEIEVDKLPQFVYGLEGVMTLFGVKSKATASRYVNTWLAPAVMRKGNKIIVNTREALKAFAENKNE